MFIKWSQPNQSRLMFQFVYLWHFKYTCFHTFSKCYLLLQAILVLKLWFRLVKNIKYCKIKYYKQFSEPNNNRNNRYFINVWGKSSDAFLNLFQLMHIHHFSQICVAFLFSCLKVPKDETVWTKGAHDTFNNS